MRKRAQRNFLHVRITLALLMTLMASLVFAGCGGGGGGGTPTPKPTPGPVSSPTLATVSGTVTDTTAAATPIAGASVQIVGTNLTATTAANGTFVILNVPVGTVRVAVVTPSPQQYSAYVIYQGKEYDTQLCPLTLTTVASGNGKTQISSPFPATIQLFPTTNSPPPPPNLGSNGCPL